MRRFSKLLLAAVTMVVLASAIDANAGRLSVTSQSFRITWLSISFRSAFGTETCPLTLEGSFHARTLPKTTNALLGYITRAALPSGQCSVGAATLLQETLPWHMRYSTFTGTLPDIESISVKLVGMGIRVSEIFFSCLTTTEGTNPLILQMTREAGGTMTGVRVSAVSSIPGCSGGLAAESPASGFLTVLGATTRVTLTLI